MSIEDAQSQIIQDLLASTPLGVISTVLQEHALGPESVPRGVPGWMQTCLCGWAGQNHSGHQASRVVEALRATPAIVVHTGDPDARAESFNEGYETAMTQQLMTDEELATENALDWLQQQRRIAWDEGFEACLNAAPLRIKTWRIPENPYEEEEP